MHHSAPGGGPRQGLTCPATLPVCDAFPSFCAAGLQFSPTCLRIFEAQCLRCSVRGLRSADKLKLRHWTRQGGVYTTDIACFGGSKWTGVFAMLQLASFSCCLLIPFQLCVAQNVVALHFELVSHASSDSLLLVLKPRACMRDLCPGEQHLFNPSAMFVVIDLVHALWQAETTGRPWLSLWSVQDVCQVPCWSSSGLQVGWIPLFFHVDDIPALWESLFVFRCSVLCLVYTTHGTSTWLFHQVLLDFVRQINDHNGCVDSPISSEFVDKPAV